MTIIKVTLEDAKKAYNEAESADVKKAIANLIGYEHFDPYTQACIKLSIAPRPILMDRSDKQAVSEDGFHRLCISIKAKNLTTEDTGTYYEPRFYDTGSGWVYDDYGFWITLTAVGPRLRYNSYDLMCEGITEFDSYYQDFLTK